MGSGDGLMTPQAARAHLPRTQKTRCRCRPSRPHVDDTDPAQHCPSIPPCRHGFPKCDAMARDDRLVIHPGTKYTPHIFPAEPW